MRVLLFMTAPRLTACALYLRDVAASRQSSNKFGSALDFRNVIKSLTPFGVINRSTLNLFSWPFLFFADAIEFIEDPFYYTVMRTLCNDGGACVLKVRYPINPTLAVWG